MIAFKQTVTALLGLTFISMSFAAESYQLENLNDHTVMLCGKISNKILDDVGSYKERDRNSEMVDLLILISNDDPNSLSDTKVVSDGKIYFKGKNTVSFDASFIMTLNGGIHTDTVTYMSRNNKIVGGYFYNSESNTDNPREVYISSVGDVYHINIESMKNGSCLNKFK